MNTISNAYSTILNDNKESEIQDKYVIIYTNREYKKLVPRVFDSVIDCNVYLENNYKHMKDFWNEFKHNFEIMTFKYFKNYYLP